MAKVTFHKPVLIMLYGFPGSGKSFFGRQLSESVHAAHISSDRIRYELLEKPTYSEEENSAIEHLMMYMSEEFIRAGMSVIFDINAARSSMRRELRDLARKLNAETQLVWLQINAESSLARSMSRDHRKADDKYSPPIDKQTFVRLAGQMQNPQNEDYVVISGMHTFNTQRSAVLKKLYERGLISGQEVGDKIIKPNLVNLIPKMPPPNPHGGRVDLSRRNIFIR